MRADEINILSCADCSIEYGVPIPLYTQRKEDGKRFYCPNGHAQAYHPEPQGPSRGDLLKENLALKATLAELQAELDLYRPLAEDDAKRADDAKRVADTPAKGAAS